MNSNIEIINEDLMAVNFKYIENGYIKGFSFHDAKSANSFAVITDDGKYMLNKVYDYKSFIPFIQGIMNLKSKELFTKHGFCKVARSMGIGTEAIPDNLIMHVVSKSEKLMNSWTIYKDLCSQEAKRRKKKKEYKKRNSIFKKNKMKGRWRNGKHTDIN